MTLVLRTSSFSHSLNQVLGIRQGELDLHGRPRTVTWTRLSQSALSNDTSLRLEQAVDWVAGDKLVIAPTGKDGNETEVGVTWLLMVYHSHSS